MKQHFKMNKIAENTRCYRGIVEALYKLSHLLLISLVSKEIAKQYD